MSRSVLDAAYHVVHDYPGGAASLAPRLTKSPTTLCHEVTATGTAKLGLLDAVKATDLSGDLRILLAWNTHAGQMMVPLPRLDLDPGDDCLVRLADLAREFSETCGEVSASLAGDGKVNDNELARVDKEIGEQIAALHALREALARNNQAAKPAHLRKGA